MWPCSSVIIKALSGISHTNICTLTIALYKRTNSRHQSTPDIVNKCTKKTSLYRPLFFKGRANIFHMAVWCCTHTHTDTHTFTWQIRCGCLWWSQLKRTKKIKVETRNLTQGIHVLLFTYLFSGWPQWIYWKCAFKAALCNVWTQNRIGQILLRSSWREMNLWLRQVWQKKPTTKWRRKSTNAIFLSANSQHFVQPTFSFCILILNNGVIWN